MSIGSLRYAIIVAAAAISCGHQRPRLEVDLPAPPVASRFIVHGNCFAGWMLHFDLRIAAEGDDDVALESLALRVEEAATGTVLAEESLDSSQLATLGPGHDRFALPVGLRVPGGVDAPGFSGAVAVAGELRARDTGGPLAAPFRLTATPTIEGALPGGGGACAAP